MANITETVYKGVTNKNKITVSLDGSPVDWRTNGVSKMKLFVGDVVLDSSVDSSKLDFQDGGVISFDLGGEDLAVGSYLASALAYDPQSPNGQPIFGPAGNSYTHDRLEIEVCNFP